MSVTVSTEQSKFRNKYIKALEDGYPDLFLHLQLWELSEGDCETLEQFAELSEENQICLGLCLATYAPRDSFSRKRGYLILDNAIEKRFLDQEKYEEAETDAFIRGVLGFLKENNAAYMRIYHVAKSWKLVRSTFANLRQKAA